MLVIERNVMTGKVTERPYTQKELDAVAIMEIESVAKKVIREKEIDIETKRNAAIEKYLTTETTAEAIAYQAAIK